MAEFEPGKLFNVKGMVVVITGGGSGIGLMMAQALEANGAIVYILGRRLEVLQKAAETAKHSQIHPLQTDVTSLPSLHAAAAHITRTHGFINLLIPNAGIQGPLFQPPLPPTSSIPDFLSSISHWTPQSFQSTFAVNTTAVFFTVVAFLELLDAGNKRGNVGQKSQVLAVASAGAFARVPMAGFAYAASKSACVHVVKQLATRMAGWGIRGNVLAPGVYPSDMTAELLAKTNGEFERDFIPEERAGSIEDMAGTVLFLASRAGGYVNGSVVLSDGGRLSVIPATY